MAKIAQDERDAISAGYAEGERVQRAYGKAKYNNPWMWSSLMWELFEFGYYLQETGRSLSVEQWERGRGNVYRNANGFAFKLHYGKGKNSFGISRYV